MEVSALKVIHGAFSRRKSKYHFGSHCLPLLIQFENPNFNRFNDKIAATETPVRSSISVVKECQEPETQSSHANIQILASVNEDAIPPQISPAAVGSLCSQGSQTSRTNAISGSSQRYRGRCIE
jgi:hypothetical protein